MPNFLFFILTAEAAPILVTLLLRAQIYRWAKTNPLALHSETSDGLSPAEAAYLQHCHLEKTMATAIADLVLRNASQAESAHMRLKPHEELIYRLVRELAEIEQINSNNYIQKPTTQGESGEPLALLPRKKVTWLYAIYGKTAATFMHKFLLRSTNLIPLSVLSRTRALAAHLAKSKLSKDFESSIATELINKNLAVARRKRLATSRALLILAALQVAAVPEIMALAISALGGHLTVDGVTQIRLWMLSGALPASLLYLVWKLPKTYPSFSRFVWASTELPADDARSHIAKISFAVRYVPLIVSVVLAPALQLFLGALVFGTSPQPSIEMTGIAGMMVCTWLLSIQMLVCGLRMKEGVLATLDGVQELKKVKTRVDSKSPLQAIATTLNSETYDPALSELIAIYDAEILDLIE